MPKSTAETQRAPGKGITYVALLRGINVGGHKLVSMTDLREFLGALGFSGARSLLQSGNLVFSGKSQAPAKLERLLETEARKRLALDADFMVRSAEEWQRVIEKNPFPDEAKTDPARLVVMFMKEAPDPKAVKALQEAIQGRERIRAEGRELYVVFPDGQGTSRLTGALMERKLGTRGTGRNWNTVVKVGGTTAADGENKP